MKKTLLCILLLVIGSAAVYAQEIYPMALGPFITLKGGVNTGNIPTGRKTSATFNGIPDFGATAYFPISTTSNIGIGADLGYSTYAILDKPNDGAVDSNTFTSKFSYLSLSPYLCANVFTLGFNFGIPLSASRSNASGTLSNNLTIDSVGIVVELRVGAMVPLVSSPTGRLDLIVQGGYMLTGIINTSTTTNPKAASVALGLNYLFTLNKKQ